MIHRFIIILFLCFSGFVYGQKQIEIDLNNQIEASDNLTYPPLQSARPLPLSLAPPMKMNKENRERFYKEEAARNVQLFKEKEFPWKTVLAIFIIAFTFVLSKKRLAEIKKKREMVLILNPRERALKSIQKADLENLSKISPEDFFIKLSDTVREYIEDEYQLKAPHYTTQEFLQKATQSTSFSEPNKKLLTNFLTQADLVKFAKYEPTNVDLQKAQEAATEFLESSGQG